MYMKLRVKTMSACDWLNLLLTIWSCPITIGIKGVTNAASLHWILFPWRRYHLEEEIHLYFVRVHGKKISLPIYYKNFKCTFNESTVNCYNYWLQFITNEGILSYLLSLIFTNLVGFKLSIQFSPCCLPNRYCNNFM